MRSLTPLFVSLLAVSAVHVDIANLMTAFQLPSDTTAGPT